MPAAKGKGCLCRSGTVVERIQSDGRERVRHRPLLPAGQVQLHSIVDRSQRSTASKPHANHIPVLEFVPMKTGTCVFFFSILVVTSFQPSSIAAHEWYPKECCNDHDCVPVESVEPVGHSGGG